MNRRARGLRVCWLATCLLPAVMINACTSPLQDFPPWGKVTRIEILKTTSPHGDVLKEISDPDQVAKIVAFVNANRTGYREPWFGEPIPRIDVAFYDRNLYQGHFGVGPEFFEIHRGSITFMSRPASEEEVNEIMELINLDSDLLRRQS
jgi:hypothetical protein